ncbi:MAG: hypothetical protein HQK54_06090 [Oligoflexales bacterium]|nr:hypothetical protein [Oligoflexales bacterium]
MEDDIDIRIEKGVETKLAVLAPANIQIYGESQEANKLNKTDFVNMLVIGRDEPMTFVENGLLSIDPGVSFYNGRGYVLTQAAEYDSTLYSIDEKEENRVISLLRRGFVEDIYMELSMGANNTPIAFDPALGTMVVRYGNMRGAENRDINIKVLNSKKEEVFEGWYYGVQGNRVTNAVFFNLEPDIYTIIVENSEKNWLDVKTMWVDYWTTSFVPLGSKIVFSN